MNKAMTIGQYIKRFCNINNITVKKMVKECAMREPYPLSKPRNLSINTYFKIAEYMAQNSNMSEEFYLRRIKLVLQGKYFYRE